MPIDGHLYLDTMQEKGQLGCEQPELDAAVVRAFVGAHLRKDSWGLTHLERMIKRASLELEQFDSSTAQRVKTRTFPITELRLLLAFYMELLHQTAAQSCPPSASYFTDPAIRQFLRSFQQHILTRAVDSGDRPYRTLIGELYYDLLLAMSKAGVEPPFGIDLSVGLIPSLLTDEATSVALRPAIERMAVELLGRDGPATDQLLASLLDAFLDADFFIVIESVSRVLKVHRRVWAGQQLRDRKEGLLRMAKFTARIGHNFAELVAKVTFATSTKFPTATGYHDQHGSSMILAKLAELFADDVNVHSELNPLLEQLAEQSDWDLTLVGPLLRHYTKLYGSESEFLHFLTHNMLPSLISQRQPSPKEAFSAFVAQLLAIDPKMEKIPEIFEATIPHLWEFASAREFFMSFCEAAQHSPESSVRLSQIFADHPKFGKKMAAIVSPVLIAKESDEIATNNYSEFQWEQELSALELLNTCEWAVPHIDPSALFRRLLQFALHQFNAFLCEPAFRLLCKHFPDQLIEHWPRIYANNYDVSEVRDYLLSHMRISIITDSKSELAIGRATEVLDKVAEMAEEEESVEIMERAVELCKLLREKVGGKGRGEQGQQQQQQERHLKLMEQTMDGRKEELREEQQYRQRKRDLFQMMEDLVPAMNNARCSMQDGTDEQQQFIVTKDCY